MASPVSEAPTASTGVVTTQSSALTQSDKVESTSKETPKQIPEQSETTSKQSTSAAEPEAKSGGASTSAERCDDSIEPAPEPEPERESSPASSIRIDDYFHLLTHSIDCPAFEARYGWIWEMLDRPKSIPFWSALLVVSVSAVIMGAVYMHSCPGGDNLASLILSLGISLTSAFSLKIGYIVFKLMSESETSRGMLRTFYGISAAISIALYGAESVTFWKMHPTSDPETSKYCDPHFSTFALWWNCFVWVAVLSLFFCPG